MTVYNQDPDVLRWGLHLLDVCSISNAGSCGTVTQYDPDLSSVEFVREGYVEAEQPNVENDQRLALALQEALSQVSLEEASGASTHGNEQFQASVLIQDWRAPLKRYSDAEGRENGNKQAGYVETEQPSVKNDELTAHAFKELSPLSLEEASGASTSGNEQLQASVLTQDRPTPLKSYSEIPFWMFLCGLFVVFLYWLCWLCWLCCNLLSFKFFRNKGRENGQQLEDQKEFEIRDEVGKAYSCSSPGEKSGSDDDVDMLHLADESVLDGEVGKRLNQMVPVPHVPKINGEIPSVEDEVSDHQRLLDRLQLYNLVENKVQGDGNCQFRALSDQLYRTPEHHEFVRRQIVQQLKSCPQMYDGYVPMAFGDYLKKMSKIGEWGDHVTLQAAADSYGVKIFVITSFKDTCYIEILPHVPKSKRVIFLSFWAEVHYNSIYPE